jgi:hypothetical protein
MDYILNIIDIVKFNYYKEILDQQLIIDYKDIKIIHEVNSKYVEIKPTNYLSFHIIRLIVNKLKINYDIWIPSTIKISKELIPDYFIYLKELLDTNFYDYCTICGNIHDKRGLIYITTCNNSICKSKVFHYPINNKITELYNLDFNTFSLLIKTLLCSFTHPKVEKILTSIPIFYGFTDLKTIINQVPKDYLMNKLDTLFNIISGSEDDYLLWLNLDNNFIFALLKNAISDNYYSMCSYNDLVNNDFKKKNISPDDNIEYFNINYSTETENDIKKKLDSSIKYYYLYHGSPFHCWYSIIKNGLKVMSGTEFMSTGAAYGNGIYLSNASSLSYGYARPTSNFNYSMIGLFQIIENPEKYFKASNIFVVPNEKILVLRTLIKINKTGHNSFSSLDKYFIHERSVDKNKSDKNLVILKNKRLSAELKLIEKFSDKFNVLYYTDKENEPWIVQLFVKDNIYKLNIHFNNYPLLPPMFEVIDFALPVKGIIDTKYKINLPILELDTWNISNKIIQVLDLIWTFFNNTY